MSTAPAAANTTAGEHEPLLRVSGLRKYFPVIGGRVLSRVVGQVHAVDGVDFWIKQGETLGVVGESGSGKTTVAKNVLRLQEPTAGQILFEGVDIRDLRPDQMRRLRREMQLVYQAPFGSLNPRRTVGETIGEPLRAHGLAAGKELAARVGEIMDRVALPTGVARRYPHEFSGGQRQRIGIARALALQPKLIVCDEPVSALDVSIQSQILNLLADLQDEFNLTYLFIAHSLAVVKHVSDRVAVMYLGRIVEVAPKGDIYRNPLHPYTEALMSAIPIPDPTVNRPRIVLEGEVPSPINPPAGCRFHTRCQRAADIGPRCYEEQPELCEVAPDHYVACHLHTVRS